MIRAIIISSWIMLMAGCVVKKVEHEPEVPVTVINMEDFPDDIWEIFDKDNDRLLFNIFVDSANGGNAQSQYVLGLYYENSNPEKANEYFQMAAKQKHVKALEKISQ